MKNNLYKKNKKGFSLVEIIVYIALASILTIAVFRGLNVIISSYNQVKTIRQISNSAITVMDRMTREIKNSTDIVADESSFGNESGVLTVMNDHNEPSTTVKFYIDNSRVYVSENGGDGEPLTDEGVSVSSLIFRSISNSTASAVKIELTLTSPNGVTSTKNFYGTATLRGSYE